MQPRERIQHSLVMFLDTHVPPEPGQPYTADTDLIETGLLDSLLMMDLVAHIERTEGIRLEYDDLGPQIFRTVRQLASHIEFKRRGGPQDARRIPRG